MLCKVRKLSTEYKGKSLDPLWVILDEQGAPPILPLLFTTHLSLYGEVSEKRRIENSYSSIKSYVFEYKPASDSTIRSYVYCLARFLSYLEECKNQHSTPGMHSSSSCSERFLNFYINSVLAEKANSSLTLHIHASALIAYYNWLDDNELCEEKKIKTYRKTRQHIEDHCDTKNYIQYISRSQRSNLLTACKTISEKLMMRMGFEVGLRTSELVGIRVDEKLSSLFAQIADEKFNSVNLFRYLLKGKFTKGGKSRWIYFSRPLLEEMHRYYLTERATIEKKSNKKDDSFFLRTDKRFFGTGIGPEQGSRVFRKRAKNTNLNTDLSFHDLRHTFATETFHSEIKSKEGRETRSESAALIVVAQRLGHSFGRNGIAPSVTTRYIRMRMQMFEVEENLHE
ncbi:site-specific integrase [uncultured Alcanivorax sp.]|jgi:site-specific recombinase XerD|uniref:tyrosine-type recombinase/integrase n=1 Tax=uncultured Alcanivorax sp. TaxID=191215 RepID=UPI002608962E|nr:site-specific integrase [uncultured Alcanivorax sp.]